MFYLIIYPFFLKNKFYLKLMFQILSNKITNPLVYMCLLRFNYSHSVFLLECVQLYDVALIFYLIIYPFYLKNKVYQKEKFEIISKKRTNPLVYRGLCGFNYSQISFQFC